jgi:hypothetical protein
MKPFLNGAHWIAVFLMGGLLPTNVQAAEAIVPFAERTRHALGDFL